jgi:hypothetical protein
VPGSAELGRWTRLVTTRDVGGFVAESAGRFTRALARLRARPADVAGALAGAVAEGVVTDISHEGLRALLREEGVSFQAVRTWKRFNDPNFEPKKNRILELSRT